MIASPDPFADVVFSKHADFRMGERFPDVDLHAARDEIMEAILEHRIQHRARNIWYVISPDGERTYPVAIHPGVTVVMTVIAPLAAAA